MLIPRVQKGNNTVAILVRDLGPYSLLYKVYTIHNMCITKNEAVGFKTYNYKTLYAWVTIAVRIVIILVLKS
jgi:hypothetical protein